MSVLLAHNAYGKSRIRLTKVERHPDRHELLEWTIAVLLTGEFAAAYSAGDNRQVIATDTMKNIVYALAADSPLGSPEAFGLVLGKHFLGYSQVETVTLRFDVEPWTRADIGGRPHPHAFVGVGGGHRTCTVVSSRTGERVTAGIADLLVLKTTDSAWRDFHRDEYRTLADADDRILATSLTADWTYSAAPANWDTAHAAARAALIEAFAIRKSLGAQHSLHAMGEAALTAVPEVDEITLTMPNRHRLLMNLQPFGRVNTDSVFVATDEPHGLISGTLRRGAPCR